MMYSLSVTLGVCHRQQTEAVGFLYTRKAVLRLILLLTIVDFRPVLIDCRTSSAMSGSPVIASQTGIFMPDGKMSGNMAFGTVSAFLGVYSGRLYGRESKTGYGDEVSEIGIVWKSSVLERITQEGSPGTELRSLTK